MDDDDDDDDEPMASKYELDLQLLTMYLHSGNELSRSRLSTVTALQTDRSTDR